MEYGWIVLKPFWLSTEDMIDIKHNNETSVGFQPIKMHYSRILFDFLFAFEHYAMVQHIYIN